MSAMAPSRPLSARTRPAPLPALAATVLVLGLGSALLTGCSGGDEEKVGEGRTPEQVLEGAKKTIDDTSGLRFSLTTDELPRGVEGISSAEGLANHQPAFDGTITGRVSGFEAEVPIIAVDGTTYAQVPLSPGWSKVDPARFGAPDPSSLLDPDTGISNLLTATTGVEEGDSVRGGEDNKEVLTEYTGTIPAAAVKLFLPGANGDDFDATYTVTTNDDGEPELRTAVLTGVFYADSEEMTYTVGLDDYGDDTQVEAPA